MLAHNVRTRVLGSAAPARLFSAAAATSAADPLKVDWSYIRSKMRDEEARQESDRARDAFQKRLAAAHDVRAASDIDWASYEKALPELDVAKMRAAYNKAMGAIPVAAYDEAADKAAHEAKEHLWKGYAKYCAEHVAELEALAAEQEKHKLHKYYRFRQLYARYPGLWEKAHNKVAGQWDVDAWAAYLDYKAGNAPYVPLVDPKESDEDKRAREDEICKRSGLTREQLGFK